MASHAIASALYYLESLQQKHIYLESLRQMQQKHIYNLEPLRQEHIYNHEQDILVGITIHKLRGLRTFLLCSSIVRSNEHNNDCELASSKIPTHKLLRVLRRLLLCSNYNVDTNQGSLLVRLEAFVVKICDGCFDPMFSGRGEFCKYLVKMESFEEEISTWYTSLSDYLQTSDSPVPFNQIKDIRDSVLENLDDFLLFHRAYVGILADQIEGLRENITFLTNFICFSTLLCAENQDIHDLQVIVRHLVISAAHLTVQLFSASHNNIECFLVDVKNSTRNLSCDGIKSMVSDLLLRIKPVDNPLLHVAYSRALESLKSSREMYVPTLDPQKFISFLLSNLWEMLQLDTSPVVSLKDKLQAFYEGLRSLRTMLKKNPSKFNANTRNITRAAMFDAGVVIFSVHKKDLEIDLGVQDFLENIKIIQMEVLEEQVALTTNSNFSKINLLRFLDFLLDDMTQVKSCKVDSDTQYFVNLIQQDLVYLISLLEVLMESRQQHEDFQALWDFTVGVAYKIEFLIDQLMLGNFLESFSASFLSITDDIENIKTGSRKMIFEKKKLIKVQEDTPTPTDQAWKEILASLRSGLMSTLTNECDNSIELSYKHLPDDLKSCFLSFGAFLEDQQIDVKRLIWLWIAEGFVQKSNSKSLEEVATDYLNILIGRSLVMAGRKRSTGEVKTCRIHDLLHDFSLRKSREEHFLHVLKEESLPVDDVLVNLRRLCVHSGAEHFKESKLFYPHLRSLLFSRPGWNKKLDMSFIYRVFKLLRVLSMDQIHLTCFPPKEIGFLVQLRYLAIQVTTEVNSSIGNLTNLETLILDTSEGYFDITLPESFWNLHKLRHLHTYYSAIKLPVNNLDSSCILLALESLSTIYIDNLDILEKQLRKCINIRRLKCRISVSGSRMSFSFLSQLESLSLSSSVSKVNITELILPENIKKLTFDVFGLSWDKISSIAELPNLEVLKLHSSCSFIGDSWHVKEGEFLKLKVLKLCRLGIVNWTTASDDQFPNLENLLLQSCLKLEEIPEFLENAATLKLIEVSLCSGRVVSQVRKIEDCQKDMGNSLLRVFCTRITGTIAS